MTILAVRRCDSLTLHPPNWIDVIACMLALLLVEGLTLRVEAQDRVIVQPPSSSGQMAVSGNIVGLDRRELVINTSVGRLEKRFPVDQIVSIEAACSEQHLQGLKQLAEGNVLEAEVTLTEAYEDESRDWVQDQLLGSLIQIALRRDDRAAAGSRFERLVSNSPNSREFGRAPLVWSSVTVNGVIRETAKRWLTSDIPPMQLLGSSMLLDDPTAGRVAEQTLQQLARNADSQVATLSQSQLWRLRLKARDVSARERASWRAQIEQMPASLQAGPMFLLGQASRLMSDHETAAADLLRLPLVLDADYDLAALAGLQAAESLLSLGRTAEAINVLDYLQVRYADAENAAVIKARLDDLRASEKKTG